MIKEMEMPIEYNYKGHRFLIETTPFDEGDLFTQQNSSRVRIASAIDGKRYSYEACISNEFASHAEVEMCLDILCDMCLTEAEKTK